MSLSIYLCYSYINLSFTYSSLLKIIMFQLLTRILYEDQFDTLDIWHRERSSLPTISSRDTRRSKPSSLPLRV